MMRKNGLLIIAGLILFGFGTGHAAFDIERPGARPSGFGGAFCAVADDADAIIYNPAGLGQVYTSVVSLNYVSLLSGLDDGSLSDQRIAYLQPIGEHGTAGVAWYQRSLEGLYTENIISLGYGFALDEASNYFLGGTLKLFHQSFLDTDVTTDNSFFNNETSLQSIGFDVGGLVYFTETFNLGISLANINQPNMAFGETESLVPLTTRLGAAYQYETYLGTMDLMFKEGHFRLSGGGEAWWADGLLGTRVGFGMGDQEVSELTAGMSLRLDQNTWIGQLDYAFVVPLGALASGITHQVNLTLLFGSGFGDGTQQRAEALIENGQKARIHGEKEKALAYWEEAAEIFSEDEELENDIQALRNEIERDSEVAYYIERGLAFEEGGHFLNAAKAYRKAKRLDSKQMQAIMLLKAVEAKIKQMSKRQKNIQKKKERQATRKAHALTRDQAARAVRDATDLLSATKKNSKVASNFPKELKRLTKQLADVKLKLRRKSYDKALVLATTTSKELNSLVGRAARLERAKARKKKLAKKVMVKPVVANKSVSKAKTVSTKSKSKPSVEKTTNEEQKRKRKKHARGAYGRAVKLMIDIDKVNGSKYFASKVRSSKRELSRIKVMLNRGKYTSVIKAAKKLYPTLNKIKLDSEKKEKARKAMPTNW